MEIGVEVQVFSPQQEEWITGIIIDRFVNPIQASGAVITVQLDDGNVCELSVPENPHATVDFVQILSKRTEELDVDDLTNLVDLDETSILTSLESRFQKHKVYTNTGTILLAVNPFEPLDELYDQSILQEYIDLLHLDTAKRNPATPTKKKTPIRPHIYHIAAMAYKSMLDAPHDACADQSVLVSGESGSGKTESTKFLMQYLAQVGSNSAIQSGIAAKVLQTSILLESFGNARTIRNDNSSRFGKFIKLHFNGSSGKLTGASIQTYLLEKVRLVSQSSGERNYHIFYEMLQGASPEERCKWRLDPPTEDTYHHYMASGEYGDVPESARQFLHYRYLNQSKCFVRRDGAQDHTTYKRVVDAMKVIGFTTYEREGIFDCLAACLHIGNLVFEHDEQSEQPSDESSDLGSHCLWSRDAAASLLTVEGIQLEKALSTRRIRAGTDFVSVRLSAEQSNNARDALAKALYGRIFEWMVSKMNEFLEIDDTQRRRNRNSFIGILDIFGFEIFPKNSFEQLCINFANETLQQQFNEYVFKLEQQEYEAQGVEWKYVDYADNQEVVNLISQRPCGILSLVDEECLIPKGNDTTFVSKLYRACEEHPCFVASRIQRAGGLFTIVHYAGNVEYNAQGFLDKNKDVLHQEAVDLLMFSPKETSFTRVLCEASFGRPLSRSFTHRSSPNKPRGASVGLQFKEQLSALLDLLRMTNPHYVRCLKPNDDCEAKKYVCDRVLSQLRCNGVMEAVRVARAGYPIRMLHEDFYARYHNLKRNVNSPIRVGLASQPLNAQEIIATRAKELLRDLLMVLPKTINSADDSTQSPFEHSDQAQFATKCVAAGIQMGISKIFLKRDTYDFVEEMRMTRLRRHMIRIFHAVLAFHTRQRYLRFRRSVLVLQSRFRLQLLRKERRELELMNASAIKLQQLVRMAMQRKKFTRFVHVVQFFQCRLRYRRMLMKRRKEMEAIEAEKQRALALAAEAERQRQLEEERIRRAEEERIRRLKEEEEERKRRLKEEEQERKRRLKEEEEEEEERKRQAALKAEQERLRLQELEKQEQLENEVQRLQQPHEEQEFAAQEERVTVVASQPTTPVTPLQYEDSFTASDSSSDEESSMTSNDVEGSSSSNDENDDIYQSFRGSVPKPAQQLNTVDETSSSMSMDAIHPMSGPGSDSKLSTGSQPKTGWRVTRSSRAVALPKLDVVQQTQWVNDEDRFSCNICSKRFNMFKRKHHCRACGEVICSNCSLYHRIQHRSMRVCVSCVAFHSLESPTSKAVTNIPTQLTPFETSGNANFGGGTGSDGSSMIWQNAWPEPPYPDDEEDRLMVLRQLNIPELANSGKFNMYCEVAAKTMKCPIAYVSVIEEEEQILIANIGMAHATLPRELSFCAHTICSPDVLVVLDTKQDDRFRENPMVKGEKGTVKIRYYAGATIYSKDGHALGTVAVFDTKPRREVVQEHVGMLKHLSVLASEKMTPSTVGLQGGAMDSSDSEFL